jgi:hypothetical protein
VFEIWRLSDFICGKKSKKHQKRVTKLAKEFKIAGYEMGEAQDVKNLFN